VRFLSGLDRSGLSAIRVELNDEFPQTQTLFERLQACLPPDARSLFGGRLRMVTALVASALQQIDFEAQGDAARAAELFEDAVTMAAVALVALPADAEEN